MKKKILITIIAAVAALAVPICFCIWFLSGTGSGYYYTRIDNTDVKQVDSRDGVIDFQGGMPYSYTLPSYSENGGEKEITFGASRELTEGAFIRLTVKPIRGVTAWEEVQYEELPAAVQNCYPVS